MARQARTDAGHHRGRLDWIGLILVGCALVWLLALLSYDRFDLPNNEARPNNPVHNWIGPLGARWADLSLLLFGAAGFLLPLVMLLYGMSCLTDALGFARRRWPWLLLLPLVSAAAFDLNSTLMRPLVWGEPAGGLVGDILNKYAFHYIGYAGSMMAFTLVYLLCLLALSDFQLFEWIRAWWQQRRADAEASLEEEARLARRAQQLEKEARRLQEIVDRDPAPAKPATAKPTDAAAALVGPDLKPIPEPTVRDLSVPQAKPTAKPARAGASGSSGNGTLEGEVITAKEIAIASGPPGAPPADAAGHGETDEVDDDEPTLPVPVRGKMVSPRKRLSVAAPPSIGNYQLPPFSLLMAPDLSVQPTESKEELMANARLMQQTLAQFGIEVALGDITKGPTITRYELHPAPGVKLEKITALTNNIAAALQRRAHPYPRAGPGKEFGRHRSAELGQDQGDHARPAGIGGMAAEQGADSAGAGQRRLRPPHHRRSRRHAAPPDRGQHRLGQIGVHQLHHRLAAVSLLARPTALRDDRPEGGRAAAVQRPAPPRRAGGHRP